MLSSFHRPSPLTSQKHLTYVTNIRLLTVVRTSYHKTAITLHHIGDRNMQFNSLKTTPGDVRHNTNLYSDCEISDSHGVEYLDDFSGSLRRVVC